MSDIKPWDKLPAENATWYARFKSWLNQAKPRSVLKAYREEWEQKQIEAEQQPEEEGARKGAKGREKKVPQTLPRTWNVAKEKYRWKDRAEAWDAAEQERLDRELAEKRKRELDDQFRLGQEMRARAREIMALPLLNEVVKRDREGNEVEFLLVPEFRAHLAGVQYAKESAARALRGLGLPEKITEQRLTGPHGGAMEMKDVTELSEAEQFAELLELARATPASGDSA